MNDELVRISEEEAVAYFKNNIPVFERDDREKPLKLYDSVSSA
jgi:hypothetical protein